MKLRSPARRRLTNLGVNLWAGGSALLGILILFWILYVVLARGLGALNLSFFTHLPTPPGMGGGGLANAMVGTLVLTGAATLMAVPLGLLAGVYLAEFSDNSKTADYSRF